MASIVHGGVEAVWGGDTYSPPTLLPRTPLKLGDVLIPGAVLGNFAVAALLIAAFLAFFRYSKTGIALRATASDPVTAATLGININYSLRLTWVLSGLVGTVAGVLIASSAGLSPLLAAAALSVFAAIILGGLDSILGAIVASLLIGWIEALGAGYLGGKSRDVVPYVVVLAILIVRPYGIFGARRSRGFVSRLRTGVFHETFASEETAVAIGARRAWMAVLRASRCSRLPLWGSDYVMAMACIVGIHVVATLGLNLTTGNAGLISLSHGAFLGVGCYTVAWLAKLGVPFYLTLPAAGVSHRAAGRRRRLTEPARQGHLSRHRHAGRALHPDLRLSRMGVGDRRHSPARRFRAPTLLGFELTGDRRNFYLIFICAFVMAVAARNLARTYIGRAFVAVRDRDFSAEILGVNLLRTKLLAFAIGAFYAGVAGGLLGYFYGAITPEYFVLTLSVFYLAAVIVGGLGTVLGSILGALFMTFVPEVLRLVAHASSQWFPGVAGLLLPMGQVVFGVLIIGFLIFEPHGLAAIWARIRRIFHLWPFRT